MKFFRRLEDTQEYKHLVILSQFIQFYLIEKRIDFTCSNLRQMAYGGSCAYIGKQTNKQTTYWHKAHIYRVLSYWWALYRYVCFPIYAHTHTYIYIYIYIYIYNTSRTTFLLYNRKHQNRRTISKHWFQTALTSSWMVLKALWNRMDIFGVTQTSKWTEQTRPFWNNPDLCLTYITPKWRALCQMSKIAEMI